MSLIRDADLERIILDFVRQKRTATEEQIIDEVHEVYRVAGMSPPYGVIDHALHALVCGRRLKREPGKWAGEFFYWLAPAKPKKPRYQQAALLI